MAEMGKPASKNLSRKELAILAIVLVVGIILLLLGFGHIVGNIRAPFMPQLLAQRERLAGQLSQTDIGSLQEKDTDHDGLSDFEEAYVYETSIYLEDSDSDGYSDKEEAEAGSNPLDKESTPIHPKSSSSPETIASSLGISPDDLEESLLESTTFPDKLSVAEIRKILAESGMSEEVLAKIDDKTLEEIYQETLVEMGGSELTPLEGVSLGEFDIGGIIPQSGEINKETLKNLSPQEMREFLIAGGADEEILNQIDDETLKSLFLQGLEEME